MGVLASVIANVNRSKRSRTFTVDDFMPEELRVTRPQKQTIEEQRGVLHQWVAWAKKTGKMKKKG